MTALPALLAAALLCLAPPRAGAGEKTPVNAGPYVPSPQSVVTDMLTLAKVGPRDFVIDLGSGDGRIVLTAAKVFGARGFGVDINPKLVEQANESARQLGLADRVRFLRQDLFETDIREASVLTLYLLPDTVNLLRDKLLAELRPGSRILSHDYPLTGWQTEAIRQFDLEDKLAISGTRLTVLFLYVVPAKAAGAWRVKLPAALSAAPAPLELRQQFTRLAGRARIGGRDVLLEDAGMRGEQIEFVLPLGGTRYAFSGRVSGARMEGTVQVGGSAAPWSAEAVR